ncbi:MAG: SPOR domain-containing protein [Thermotogae bacterium]|nr:SPOR domain-containing protein [Thermotogota bacterium]
MVLSSFLLAQAGGWVFIDPRSQGQVAGNRMGWRVQVGAFIHKRNAERLAAKLHRQIDQPIYIVVEPPWHKVLVGDFVKKEDAEKYLEVIRSLGYADAFVKESPVNAQNDDSLQGGSQGQDQGN